MSLVDWDPAEVPIGAVVRRLLVNSASRTHGTRRRVQARAVSARYVSAIQFLVVKCRLQRQTTELLQQRQQQQQSLAWSSAPKMLALVEPSAQHKGAEQSAAGVTLRRTKRVSWQASEARSGQQAASAAAGDGDADGIVNAAYAADEESRSRNSGHDTNGNRSDNGSFQSCGLTLSADVGCSRSSSEDTLSCRHYGLPAPDAEQLSALLRELRGKLDEVQTGELHFLGQLFSNDKFTRALALLNNVEGVRSAAATRSAAARSQQQQQEDERPAAVAVRLSTTVCGSGDTSRELTALLRQPHIRGLLSAYDILAKAQESPLPSSIAADDDEVFNKVAEYAGKNIRIVHILKNDNPLGVTVRNKGEAVIVGRVVQGSAAARDGALHEGDELLEVNGLCMRGRTIDDVSSILATMSGPLALVISRSDHCNQPPTQCMAPAANYDKDICGNSILHVRALFDYVPEEDAYLPCKELGLSFRRGDVLQVIDRSDTNWWQAYRLRGSNGGGIAMDGSGSQLAGLIPSKSFHNMRETLRIWSATKQALEMAAQSKQPGCYKFPSVLQSKRNQSTAASDDTPEVLSYMEVADYLPPTNRKRPLVLVGLPEAGRKYIRDLLMQRAGFGQFSTPVPHTTRRCRAMEVDGKDYYFVRRLSFEADIRAENFVEHGRFEGHYYGTTINSVRKVYESGRTCILILHPLSLPILYRSGLMPYVVYIALPQSPDKLKLTLLQQTGNIDVSNEQLDKIIERGRAIEQKYGHLFDRTLVNRDHGRTAEALMNEINRLKVESQWVPVSWLQQADTVSSDDHRQHATADLRGAIWT